MIKKSKTQRRIIAQTIMAATSHPVRFAVAGESGVSVVSSVGGISDAVVCSGWVVSSEEPPVVTAGDVVSSGLGVGTTPPPIERSSASARYERK